MNENENLPFLPSRLSPFSIVFLLDGLRDCDISSFMGGRVMSIRTYKVT